MTEEEEGDYLDGDENEEDTTWADEETEAGTEEEEWERNDPFFDETIGNSWTDQEGGFHELHYGEPDIDESEYRQSFDTFDEATQYINEILTGADQFFDVYYDDEGKVYEVYYMGGSE